MHKNSCLFPIMAIICLYLSQAQAADWWCKQGQLIPLTVTAHLEDVGDKIAIQNRWTQQYFNKAIQYFNIELDKSVVAVPNLEIEYMCHRGNGQGGNTG